MKKLKVITQKDNLLIIFGEWYDKVNGNTYYDATVRIGDCNMDVSAQYGYSANGPQSIIEALESVGYRLRNQKKDRYAPVRNVRTILITKLKRELNK